MDEQRFDALTKAFAIGHSRRAVLKALGGGVGAALASVGMARVTAAQGNSDCAHFCTGVFPPGPDRGQCVNDAANGTGLCYACGPAAQNTGLTLCGQACIALGTNENCSGCGDVCTSPNTCGGGDTAGVCGCTPATCQDLGITCGPAPDGCENTLECGQCGPCETCTEAGTCQSTGTPCGSNCCSGTTPQCNDSNQCVCTTFSGGEAPEPGSCDSGTVCENGSCIPFTCPAGSSLCQHDGYLPTCCGGGSRCFVCDNTGQCSCCDTVNSGFCASCAAGEFVCCSSFACTCCAAGQGCDTSSATCTG